VEIETLAPGDQFVVRSCWNEYLVLAIVNGRAVLQWLNPSDPAQLWQTLGMPRPATIRNVLNAAPVGVEHGSVGLQLLLSTYNNNWLVEKMGAPTHCILSGTEGLVMALKGTDFDTGTQVVLANPNPTDKSQQWTFVPASSIPPAPTPKMVSFHGAQYAMYEDTDRMTIDTYPANDHRFHYKMVTWPFGIAFQNRATGHFFGYAGDNAKIRAYPEMCLATLWEQVPHEEANWFRFRSAKHPNMYLNAMNTDRAPVRHSDLNTAAFPGQFSCQMWRLSPVFG